jgi:hypothetical protein
MKKVLKEWFIKHPIIYTFIVMAIIWWIISGNKENKDQPQEIIQAETTKESLQNTENFNILPEFISAKQMVNWKCRYFFMIKNNDSTNFEWTVKINLINLKWKKIWKDEFFTETSIVPDTGNLFRIEISTCPVSIFWEYWIDSFSFEAFKSWRIVNSWTWKITFSD